MSKTYIIFCWLAFALFLATPMVVGAQFRQVGTPIINSIWNFNASKKLNDFTIYNANEIFVASDAGLSIQIGNNVLDILHLRDKKICFVANIDNHVYAIGPNGLTSIKVEKSGPLKYISIPLDTNGLSQLKSMVSDEQILYLNYNTRLLKYHHKSQAFLPSVENVVGLYKSNNNVFYRVSEEGIFSSEGILLPGSQALDKFVIKNILRLDSSTHLILTEANGLYLHDGMSVSKWSRETFDLFTLEKINDGLVWKNNIVLLSNNNIYILNRNGKVVRYFNLPDSKSILKKLAFDADQNLMLLGEKDFIKAYINIPATLLCPEECLQINDVEIYNERLYLATPQGLFYTAWSEEGPYELYPKFNLVPNSRGRVNTLDIVRNDLLMGHEDGAFHIYENRAILLSSSGTTYTFKPFRYDNTVVAGTSNGIDLYKKIGHRLIFDRKLAGITDPVYRLEEYNDTLFVLSPNFGISKVFVYPNMTTTKLVPAKIPSDIPTQPINLAKIGNELYISTSTEIYKYEIESGRFTSQNTLTEILDLKKNVNFLHEDINENIWYISNNKPGLLELTEDSISETYNHFPLEEYLPLQSDLDINSIFSYNNENTFVSTSAGALYLDCTQLKKLKYNETLLQALSVNDSLIYINGKDLNGSLSFAANENSLTFYFQKSDVEHRKYSHFLSNGDTPVWSSWDTEGIKTFKNLTPGNYSFSVKSSADEGANLLLSSIDFTINRPQLSFPFEYLAYAMGFALLVSILLLIPSLIYRKKLKKLQKENIGLQQLFIDKLPVEKAVSSDTHLILATKTLITKSLAAKNVAIQLTKTKFKSTKSDISPGAKLIKAVAPTYEDWEEFFFQFEQVHASFLTTLISTFPGLNQEEQRMCVFYKIKLNDEEIKLLSQKDKSAILSLKKNIHKTLKLSPDIPIELALEKY